MKNLYTPLLFIIFLFSSVTSLTAQSILRGPYLQSPGPNSIIIRWRTDTPTDSRVYYGTSIGSQTLFADSATATTEHRVKINGLTPLTKYYYSVGTTSNTLRGNDAALFFNTAPDASSHSPVRFWTIGDFGHGNDAERKVRDSYLQYAVNSGHPADAQIWVGDNAYSDGTDLEFQNKVFDTVNCFGNVFLNLPFITTSGNHDYNSICPWQNSLGIPVLCSQDPNTHTGPYLNIIDPPTQGELGGVASGRKIFYSMDYGDVHIVSMNSELGSYTTAYNWTGVLNTSQTFTSPMLDWLKADLAATTKKWKVVIWHQTPYSGQDDFTEENSVQIFCTATRHHFNPILEQYGVDLVLVGHDHNYQRTFLINGHYGGKPDFDTATMMINGTSGREAEQGPYVKYTNGPLNGVGTVYVIAGNSSEGNTYSPITHPAIYWGEACDTCYGSFIWDVNGDRLDGRYLTGNGEIRDSFTIVKQQWSSIQKTEPLANKVKVAPNPFTDQTEISFALNTNEEVHLDVYDMSGKKVASNDYDNTKTGRQIYVFDGKNLSAGQYFYELKTEEQSLRGKLMLVK